MNRKRIGYSTGAAMGTGYSCVLRYLINMGDLFFSEDFEIDHLAVFLSPREKKLVLERLAPEPEENPHAGRFHYRRNNFEIEEYPRNKTVRMILSILNDKLKALESDRREIQSRLNDLRRSCGLTAAETEILCLMFSFAISDHLLNIVNERRDSSKNFRLLSKMTGLPVSEIKNAVRRNGRLQNMGLIESGSRSRYGNIGELSDEVVEHINGISDIAFQENFFSHMENGTYPLGSFHVKTETIETLKKVLLKKKAVAILIYGVPGSGKTEFVKSLLSACRKKGYAVNQGDGGDIKHRRSGILLAGHYAMENRGVVVMDEADEFLNTSISFFFNTTAQKKGWLNEYLDSIKSPHIFIVNRISDVEESVRRRFLCSVHFEELDEEKRIGFFRKASEHHPLREYITEEFIDDAVLRYKLSVAGISEILDLCHDILKTEKKITRKRVERTLRDLMERQHELLRGKIPAPRKPVQNYELSVLNTDIPHEKLLKAVELHLRRKKSDAEQISINLLFHGLPGTGKTEFAKYISDTFKRKLLVKRGSELLSPFVGMTERKIAAAFRQAEEENKILLIDEADTFLSNRANHQREWESTMTNEFLVRMEEFSGILICTTNRLKGLDPASLRRFHWKVEFLPLRKEERLKLFQRYFPRAKGVKEIETLLQSIPGLTFGDFNAVSRKLSRTGENLTAEEIAKELQREASYREEKREKIGFG